MIKAGWDMHMIKAGCELTVIKPEYDKCYSSRMGQVWFKQNETSVIYAGWDMYDKCMMWPVW